MLPSSFRVDDTLSLDLGGLGVELQDLVVVGSREHVSVLSNGQTPGLSLAVAVHDLLLGLGGLVDGEDSTAFGGTEDLSVEEVERFGIGRDVVGHQDLAISTGDVQLVVLAS